MSATFDGPGFDASAIGGVSAAGIVHASCVAVDGQGLLILGHSGSGKSGLALQLMVLGARLVADDRTRLTPREGTLIARAPAAIAGRIEARGMGLLAAEALTEAPVALAVDLARVETERLPPRREITLFGIAVPLCHASGMHHFPAALMQYIRGGRIA